MKRQFDHLLICSPSGAVIEEDRLDRGIQVLQGYGLPMIEQGNTRARFERFAGTDQERVQALNMALGLPQTGLIVCTRGGYGLSRLLHNLDLHGMASSCARYEHLLCGHSDLTGLQLALLKMGAPPSSLLHGPMVCFDFGSEEGANPDTVRFFEDAAFGGQVDIRWTMNSPHVFSDGSVLGPVWGGNLSLVSSLMGTPWQPEIPGGILVLEDINEPFYKVERMLMQLLHAGVLSEQSALVLGDFGNLKASTHDQGFGLDSIIKRLSEEIEIPILQQFTFGHCTPKACWFQGGVGQLSWKVNSKGVEAQLKQSITLTA